MGFITLFMMAVGLSMDALAVSICKGLAMQKFKWKNALIVGVWFGGFQALMPLTGYLLGSLFADMVSSIAPYLAFGLLVLIGGNMIRESLSGEEDIQEASVGFKTMLLLAVATSIDALAVGVSFAFLKVNIIKAITLIGITTFSISTVGVAIGCFFGSRYKSKAELAGGLILILLGIKILAESFVELTPHIYIQLALLIIGFVLLIKGADIFVEGASKTAAKLGIPQIVIGLTIVAFGTSAPEAAISITAGIQGSSALAIGNILGSNILNVLLILGIASCLMPLTIQKTTFRYEIPYVFLISILLLLLGRHGNEISRLDGIILWILMLLFLAYLVVVTKKGLVKSEETEALTEKDKAWKLVLMLLFGGGCIVIGSRFTVDAATEIAMDFGVTERIIGLTIVAFGTSLPELITSVTAAMKKKADIAVGNIVGSNLFNILFVIGTTALINPVTYLPENILDNVVAILVMVMLFLFVWKDQKLKRAGGIVMLVSYAVYFTYIAFA